MGAGAGAGCFAAAGGTSGRRRAGLCYGSEVPGQKGLERCFPPSTLPKRWYVIAQPGCTVSTAEIFADPALTRHTSPITVQAFFSGAGHNDLQDVVLPRYPEVTASVGMALSALPDGENDGQWRLCFCRAGDRGISAPNCGRRPKWADRRRGRGRGPTPRNAGS